MKISTEDIEVKVYFRRLNEPICLFGEDPAHRRDRLKLLLINANEESLRKTELSNETQTSSTTSQTEQKSNTVWYHEGSEQLELSRIWLTEYSFIRIRDRLRKLHEKNAQEPETKKKARMHDYNKELKTFDLISSQVGDSRPVVYCSFSPDGSRLATASWSGVCKTWSLPSCSQEKTLKGHSQKVSCIKWHPEACVKQSESSVNLASSDYNGNILLWNMIDDHPLAGLQVQDNIRVSRLAFHPSGRFIGSTCHDKSWRLWDLEMSKEILHQEGHVKAVFDIAFHVDGSLALTGSLDSYARVWDLRTGRCIMFLAGHTEECVGVDIAINGLHALTCSVDNTVRIWDLRQQQTIYVIPAHKNVCSGAKFEPFQSRFIATCSFDGSAKIWGHPVWTHLNTLQGHSGKIAALDINHDAHYIATCSHDTTFKIWEKS